MMDEDELRSLVTDLLEPYYGCVFRRTNHPEWGDCLVSGILVAETHDEDGDPLHTIGIISEHFNPRAGRPWWERAELHYDELEAFLDDLDLVFAPNHSRAVVVADTVMWAMKIIRNEGDEGRCPFIDLYESGL